MDFQEVGWGMDFFAPAQDRDRCRALVNAIKNLRVPRNAGYFLTGWRSDSFSGRTQLHGVTLSIQS